MLINNAHPGADFKIFNIETVRSGHYWNSGRHSKENLTPMSEYQNTFLAELDQTLFSLFNRLLLFRMSLAEELVGKTDYFLLHRHRYHLPVGHRKITFQDLFQGKTGAGVTFSHQGMTRQPLFEQQFGPQITVT